MYLTAGCVGIYTNYRCRHMATGSVFLALHYNINNHTALEVAGLIHRESVPNGNVNTAFCMEVKPPPSAFYHLLSIVYRLHKHLIQGKEKKLSNCLWSPLIHNLWNNNISNKGHFALLYVLHKLRANIVTSYCILQTRYQDLYTCVSQTYIHRLSSVMGQERDTWTDTMASVGREARGEGNRSSKHTTTLHRLKSSCREFPKRPYKGGMEKHSKQPKLVLFIRNH